MKTLIRNIFLYLAINSAMVFGCIFSYKLLSTISSDEPIGNLVMLLLPVVIYIFVVLTKGIVEDIIKFAKKKLNKKKH